MKIQDSVALVTGGASGLGWATATRLAQCGARVVVIDLPSPGAGSAVAGIAGATFVAGDVTSESDVLHAVDIATDLGSLRIVVNCAGIATPGRVIGRTGPLPLAAFERIIRINLVGTFNVIRLAAVAIQATEPLNGERGVIVSTASIAAFDGQIGQSAYAASKGAVAAITLPIAREFASSLIRVATIAPGIFDTPMMTSLSEAVRTTLAEQVPHPARLGAPDEFAALVQHVVENPYLNAETIRLDGAIRMGPR